MSSSSLPSDEENHVATIKPEPTFVDPPNLYYALQQQQQQQGDHVPGENKWRKNAFGKRASGAY